MVDRDHPYRRATFMLSVASLSQLPDDEGAEVAIVGRSNAGKSSAINTITGINSLARTSKTPGRTQQINFFEIADGCRLADLPGYGYAKVPLSTKQKWMKLIEDYFQTRQSLKGLIIVMDCRRPLQELDTQLLSWCCAANMPAHLLLTKADKLSRGAAGNTLQAVRRDVARRFNPDNDQEISVQLFSSLKKTGIEEAHVSLDSWLKPG
ncbi:MAG TPA: YihA family ribosome biogenesis GTP-binding protein [Chromatiales bacterium]|nr:YihA family ribosome biogenesis GTP-binding protein [Chromatiales bacterium]